MVSGLSSFKAYGTTAFETNKLFYFRLFLLSNFIQVFEKLGRFFLGILYFHFAFQEIGFPVFLFSVFSLLYTGHLQKV